ncbi:DUF2321 domain-containing protein [Virgibacillus sp. DJP39]|uniref:DUF2321 domain-containing protein n=1 Tax=Virgibacillus sp. DJP39 TaxID=3409790 RepID=UPI003BB75919
MGCYPTAQICMGGHAITDSLEISPELSANFCDLCGRETISKCQKCDTNIRGDYNVDGVVALGGTYSAPKYCHDCGSSYPWTNEALEVAYDLADVLDELSDEEINNLKITIDELVQDGPKADVASAKFKKTVSNSGPSIANSFNNILSGVLSEAIKKSIWG